MIAIGRYLLFIISLAGMILSEDPFTYEGECFIMLLNKTRITN